MSKHFHIPLKICQVPLWNKLYMCCAFVGLDNKLYKMHGTYINIHQNK